MPTKGSGQSLNIDIQVRTPSGEYVTLKRLQTIEMELIADEEIRQYITPEIMSGEFTVNLPRRQTLRWCGLLSRAEARCPKKKMRKLRRIKRRLRWWTVRITKDIERGKYDIH